MVRLRLAWPRRLRIRTYLLLLVLSSAMPFALLSSILVTRTASTQANTFGRDVTSVARALSLALDNSIEPLQAGLEALSRSRALASGDLAAFTTELTAAARLLDSVVLLTDAAGGALLDSRGASGLPAGTFRAPPGYVAAVAAMGRPSISDIYPGVWTRQMLATVDVPLQFPGSGGATVHGVLSSTIDLAAINDLVSRQTLPDTWIGSIVDRQGNYVQRTIDNAKWMGMPSNMRWVEEGRRVPAGWVSGVSQEGVAGYTGFVTSSVTGWTVGISVPSRIVWAPLWQRLAELLAVGAGLTGLAVALASLLARRIARPVSALARLAANPDAALPASSSGIEEVDEVAQALRENTAARSKVEAALRESEAELRAATDLSPQFPWTADPSGRLLCVSERMAELTGAPNSRQSRAGWLNFVHPDDRRAVQDAWLHAVRSAQPYDHEFRLRLADGGWTWFRARAAPRLDPAGQVLRWYGATEEVDARRAAVAGLQRLTDELEARVEQEVAAREAAQARLNQAQRLQALGQLAGGVAHDFNNVLQVVGGALALIARRPDEPARVARLAAMAEDAAERGAAITGRLLSLTRQGRLRSGPVEPALLLSDMEVVLAHTLGVTIAVRVSASVDLPPLLADRRQLETVLINLAANARAAMPDGGALTLSAALEHNPDGVSSPGGFIRIEVIDTGEGMDAATLARASEPFFTTKDVGRGTGLGLAMARGFVEQSGGGMQIESTLGRGTVVRLWLPCAEGAARQAAEPLRLPRRPGRVLLVDDDPAVRATLSEQLREHGFKVMTAPDGAAALAALAGDWRVALLVADLTMPGMDGVALIHAAQQARPGLPAILVTGHAGGEASLRAAHDTFDGPVSLLQKPVSAVQLADRIATMVERRADAV